MKKILTAGLFLFILFANPILANNAGLFTYDEELITAEFAELNELERYIEQNEGVTLTQLQLSNIPLVKNISYNTANPFNPNYTFDDPLFGIPAFFWGCFGWLFGVAAVYVLTDGDQHETKNSVIGCILSSLFFGAGRWWWGLY